MNVPMWVLELASAFWRVAGVQEPFPRSLREAAANVFEGPIVRLPGMRLSGVRAWQRQVGMQDLCTGPDRPLRACLVAQHDGCGIFIDELDPPEEQRFSLAHELAHWLRDYWQPRHHACARLGDPILEVLDGKRPPRFVERLDSVLRGVPIGPHVHYMERVGNGVAASCVVARAEAAADRLAYELLAPAETLAERASWDRVSLTQELQTTYGMPPAQANAYGNALLPAPRPRQALLDRVFAGRMGN